MVAKVGPGRRQSLPLAILPASPSSRIRPSEAPILAARTFDKYLISVGSIVRAQLKSAVVKTYPIPRRRFPPLNSSRHVSAKDPAQERRQDARLLERGREQACCRWPRRAAPRSVLGGDQFLAGCGVAQGHRGARRRRGTSADDGAVPRGSLHRPSRPTRQSSSFACRTCGYAGRANGAPVGWPGSCGRRCSSTASGPTAFPRAAKARNGIRSCRCWSRTG